MAPIDPHRLAACALLGLALLAGFPAAAQQAPAKAEEKPARVVVDAVVLEPLAQTVPVLGRLVPTRMGEVAAKTRGAVREFRVEVGDRVETGQVIALLDAEHFELERRLRGTEVDQARAARRTANAEVALLRQELERIEGLRKSAAFNQARLDDKRREIEKSLAALGEADAGIARSQAALAVAEADIRDCTITAPYPGVIANRHTEIGAYVNAGEPVISLIDDATLEIEADVPTERLAGLPPDAGVTFDIADARGLAARVRAVIPNENPLTRTRAVRFTPRFEAASRSGLAANQSVTLHLPAGARRDVLTVHKDAILKRKGQDMVFIALDGRAELRSIEIGEATGSRFVVKEGLGAGDTVVVRGNERLRPGQAIEPDTAR